MTIFIKALNSAGWPKAAAAWKKHMDIVTFEIPEKFNRMKNSDDIAWKRARDYHLRIWELIWNQNTKTNPDIFHTSIWAEIMEESTLRATIQAEAAAASSSSGKGKAPSPLQTRNGKPFSGTPGRKSTDQGSILCFRCGDIGHKTGSCSKSDSEKTTRGSVVLPRNSANQLEFNGKPLCAQFMLRGNCDANPCSQPHICSLCRKSGHAPRHCKPSSS